MFYILVEESKIKWGKENKDKAGEMKMDFRLMTKNNNNKKQTKQTWPINLDCVIPTGGA